MKQLDIEYDTKLRNKDVFLVTEWNSGRTEKQPFKTKGDGKPPKKIQDTIDKLKTIPTVRRVFVSNK